MFALSRSDRYAVCMVDTEDVGNVLEGAAKLAKEIPVYKDAVQPAAKSLGRSLEVVAKAVEVALAPVAACVWGYDQIKTWLCTQVAERMKSVPPEDVISPAPNVAGPIIEAMKYAGTMDELPDLFAGLLSSSMDR